jgi:non-specific serine/threonine protein kinase
MSALIGLRDPFGLLLAALAAVTLLAFQEGPLVAAVAALSVVAFRVAVAPVVGRLRPRPQPRSGTLFPPAPPGHPWYHPLTHRESEVALLIAEGLTSKEIGEKLHSERTVDGHLAERGVEAHVQNIMNKLNMNRRTQISAWVAERRPRAQVSQSPTPR